MRIVWDESKRASNLKKHRLDFADLTDEFFATAVVLPAKGKRLMAINDMFAGIVTVVFSPLGSEAISLVSMRPASWKERQAR